jgi:phosphopantetheinyl transferase
VSRFRSNVWTLDTSTIPDRELDALMPVLSRDETETAFRFRLRQDRVGYVLGHCLARIALARAAGCGPASLRFGKRQHGQPFVIAPQDASGLSFSLSHTAGFVGIAISRYPVGLDVECLLREIDLVEMAEEILTERELRSLRSLERSAMRERFFQLWTLKESYLKMTGLGFLGDPRSCSFDQEGDRLKLDPLEGLSTGWRFDSRFFGETHCLALCHSSREQAAQFHDGRRLLLGRRQ